MPTTGSSSPLLLHDLPAGLRSSFFWRSGAILAAAGMLAGAFGAHALKRRPGVTADNIHAWDTASHYAIANGLGLMLVSMHPSFSAHRFAGPAILGGGAVFSSSIITLVLFKNLKFLGPITPLGGIVMIAGYVALAV
ncbi:hypothetical protein PAXRUDRAFT_823200 [Paxillus rubicundulus Ve08.2h10]|uniref:DUF423-domain-containing protein n=1 Tax=Paxillus rubicundulus Ve08.2h10 TaxID=930991 RepID=A0A0D0DVQ5_9AGAM|nr:hypothetical protein PAXRUDRAFT_823200 [Paxillus rubicundulus Ve08.2h10]